MLSNLLTNCMNERHAQLTKDAKEKIVKESSLLPSTLSSRLAHFVCRTYMRNMLNTAKLSWVHRHCFLQKIDT